MISSRKYISLVKQVSYDIASRYFKSGIPPNIKTLRGLRTFLGDMLIKLNVNLGENTLNKIDDILQYELIRTPINSKLKYATSDNPHNIFLFRGDITTLNIDCIVNAGNSKGLGCFFPSHKCVDNIIHRKAGPRLRAECNSIMQSKGVQILTSDMIITKGYNLPCKYVLHVVGPIYGKDPDPELFLSKCYIHCLNKSMDMRLESIAFCCISTGEYGFPKRDAALIAYESVKAWIRDTTFKKQNINWFMNVVFCVYNDQDEQIYKRLLG